MSNIGQRLMGSTTSMSYQVVDEIADIDQITKTGNFFIENPMTPNLPLTEAGYLTVRTSSTRDRLFQYYQGHGNAKLYMRFGTRVPSEGISRYDFVDWIELVDPEKQIPDASETARGLLRLATQAEVSGGTDDQTALTPKKLRHVLTYGTADVTPGVTPLATGAVYMVYE